MSNIQEVQKLASWVEGIQSDHSRWARYSCQANMSLVWDWIAERHLAMSPASVICCARRGTSKRRLKWVGPRFMTRLNNPR